MITYVKEHPIKLNGYSFEKGILNKLVTQAAERRLTKISICIEEVPCALF